MFISNKDLENKKVFKRSQYSIIYDLGNDILAKRLINLDDKRMALKRQKILLAGEYQMIPNLSVPIDTLETEDGIVGYLFNKLPGVIFIDLSRSDVNRSELKEIVKIVGLQRTQFADILIRAFDYDLSNRYIGDAIQELKRDYVLSPHIEKQPRTFIKK